MDKRNIIAGNWKMYKTPKETEDFIKEITPKVSKARALVYIAPPFVCLPAALRAKPGSNFLIGAQNMHDELEGAFTGEISIKMLKSMNVDFVILGHSERRHVFKEDDAFINRKVLTAIKENLQLILCIGETLEQRENNQTDEVLESQILKGLKNVTPQDMENVILAYEPVWAIGTGKTATPQMAETAHCHIRKLLIKHFDKNIANQTNILYGGSVKPQNVSDLLNQENIEGVLVGGASLDVNSFAEIVNKG
ncbi:MAG: triose-phosphate isomerase [Parachlamydiales bacterium]|nr:triose-phosphate isomerase [Parachlamydiales bacterium]